MDEDNLALLNIHRNNGIDAQTIIVRFASVKKKELTILL